MGVEAILDTPLATAVRAVGSQSAYARLTKQSQGNVHRALSVGALIRDKDIAVVAAATGLPKEQLRPDLYCAPDPTASVNNLREGTRA